MKLVLESTEEFVQVDGAIARLWRGTSAAGVPVYAFVLCVAVPAGRPEADYRRFAAELVERAEPVELVPVAGAPVGTG